MQVRGEGDGEMGCQEDQPHFCLSDWHQMMAALFGSVLEEIPRCQGPWPFALRRWQICRPMSRRRCAYIPSMLLQPRGSLWFTDILWWWNTSMPGDRRCLLPDHSLIATRFNYIQLINYLFLLSFICNLLYVYYIYMIKDMIPLLSYVYNMYLIYYNMYFYHTYIYNILILYIIPNI